MRYIYKKLSCLCCLYIYTNTNLKFFIWLKYLINRNSKYTAHERAFLFFIDVFSLRVHYSGLVLEYEFYSFYFFGVLALDFGVR